MTEKHQISYEWDVTYNLFEDYQDTGPEVRDHLDIGDDEVPSIEQMEDLEEKSPFAYPSRQLMTGVKNNVEMTIWNESEKEFPGGELTNIQLMIPIGGTYTQSSAGKNYHIPSLEPGEKHDVTVEVGRPGKVNAAEFSFNLLSEDNNEVEVWNRSTGEKTKSISVTIADREKLRILSELHKIRRVLEEQSMEK